MINENTLKFFKRGAYLVNTARGKLVDRDAFGSRSGKRAYRRLRGRRWFPQPAPKDHPWRTMPNHAMTPHISGTSLSAQTRYAAGVREILESYFDGRPIRNEYLVVQAASWPASARIPIAKGMRRRLGRGRALHEDESARLRSTFQSRHVFWRGFGV